MKAGDWVLITKVEEGVWPGIDPYGDMKASIGTVKKVLSVGGRDNWNFVVLEFPRWNYKFRMSWVMPFYKSILTEEEFNRINNLNHASRG